MRILGYLPNDGVFKAALTLLENRSHTVCRTFSFGEFRRLLKSSDVVLMNYLKNDTPRYVLKALISSILASISNRPIILFFSVDSVDLCDRLIQRLYLKTVNRIITSLASQVGVLPSRGHIHERYSIPVSKRFYVDNHPDIDLWASPNTVYNASMEDSEKVSGVNSIIEQIKAERKSAPRVIHFLYHGELLWWHGLDLYPRISNALARQGVESHLIVAGHFYHTSFHCLGMTATSIEPVIKRKLWKVLHSPNVKWLGRVPQPLVQKLMRECDFHLSQLRGGHIQADSELRTCLLEAMAAGMICLHRKTMAIQNDTFKDGENIIILPDNADEAAAKIIALQNDGIYKSKIRQSAAKAIRTHYDLNNWIIDFENTMKQSVASTTPV